MVQLGTWRSPKVGGVQPWRPRIVGRVQVTSWCHLAWEARSRLLWSQEAARNVGLVGDGGWPRGELSKGWGAGRGGWERLGEGPRSQEAGTCKRRVRSWVRAGEGWWWQRCQEGGWLRCRWDLAALTHKQQQLL